MTIANGERATAIDAFAGCGGLSLGLRRAGFDVRVAFDNNRFAAATYRRNIGGVFLQVDARKLAADELLAAARLKAGECALLAGGPPCQGFSVQRRDPHGDDRNGLLAEFLRFVADIRPALFVMENVQGLKGTRSGAYFRAFLQRAQELGYLCQWRVLDAVDYGVPQSRRRLFVVGERETVTGPHFDFPAPTHASSDRLAVRDAIGDLPPPPPDHAEHPDWPNHRQTRMSALNLRRISFVPQGGGWQNIPEHLRAECHSPGAERIGHRYVYGRMDWGEPAPTITARFDSFTRGKFAHPRADRTITLREGARLQTFSDSFVFEGPQEEVASQIGNAVPPRLAEALGRALLDALARRERNALGVEREHQLALPLR